MRWTSLERAVLSRSDDGAAVRHTREGASGAAASLLMREGRHRLTVKVERCDGGRGFLYVGVIAADERTAGWPTRPLDVQPGSTQPLAWGLCPLNGHLHVCTDPGKWGALRRKVLAADLSGRASGVAIVVHVDMDRRTLAFEVDEGDGAPSMGRIDAGVHLPPAVRPWVLLGHRDDEVRLIGYRGPALVSSAIAAEEWLRHAVPTALAEFDRSASLARDTFAMNQSRDWQGLVRLGLVTESLLQQVNEGTEVATTASALASRLVSYGLLAPLSAFTAQRLRPPHSAATQPEPIFVLPCVLPDRGKPPAAPALQPDPPKPYVCMVRFHAAASASASAAAAVSAASTYFYSAAALSAAAAAADDAAAGGGASPGPAARGGSRGGSAPPRRRSGPRDDSYLPKGFLPEGLWCQMLTRLIEAADLYCEGEATMPPTLSHKWTHLSLQGALLELRRMPDTNMLKLSIWSHAPGPIAEHVGSLAQQVAARWSEAEGSHVRSQLLVREGGEAYDLAVVQARLRDHRPVLDPLSKASLPRGAFAPWVAKTDRSDVFLSCRHDSDGPLASALHLALSSRTLGTVSGRKLVVHLERGDVLGDDARSGLGPTGDGRGGSASAAGAAAAPSALTWNPLAPKLDVPSRFGHLRCLGETNLCVPILSYTSLNALSKLRPSKGADWCDPMLLEWGLVLELHAAGMLPQVSPLLIGSLRLDGSVTPFTIGRKARAAAPSGGGLPDEVSHATLAELQRLTSRRFGLKVSVEGHRRTIRGTIDALVRRFQCIQWSDLAPAVPDGGGERMVGGDSDAAFQRACLEHAFGASLSEQGSGGGGAARELGRAGAGAGDSLGNVTQPEQLAALDSFTSAPFAAAFASSSGRLAPKGPHRLDFGGTLAAAAGAIEHLARDAARQAAVDAGNAGRPARGLSGEGGGGAAGGGAGEMGDVAGVERLLGAARLVPAEHQRALVEGLAWCERRGVEVVEDLIGGGVDARADAALWEDFVGALGLSQVLGNRVRRELVRRRAELIGEVGPGRGGGGATTPQSPQPPRSAPRSGSKRRRRSHGSGCSVQ